MDGSVYTRVVEALTQVGANEVLGCTRWTARFGERTVEVIISDAGPAFAKRYSARAMDEAGFVALSGPCHTVPGAIGGLDWSALLTS